MWRIAGGWKVYRSYFLRQPSPAVSDTDGGHPVEIYISRVRD